MCYIGSNMGFLGKMYWLLKNSISATNIIADPIVAWYISSCYVVLSNHVASIVFLGNIMEWILIILSENSEIVCLCVCLLLYRYTINN